MKFKNIPKEKIEEASKLANSLDNLTDREKEIFFEKMVDKILDSLNIDKRDKNRSFSKEKEVPKEEKDYNIQELYHERSPQTHLDTIILIAFYYHFEGKQFTSQDILDSYKLLLIPSPSNVSDLINKNRRKGLIMVHSEEEGKKKFTITRKGLNYVKNNFNEDES